MEKRIKDEALAESSSLGRMNAPNAEWYAFCHNKKCIVSGEFVYRSEGEPAVDRFDGYVDLKTNEVFEL